MEGATGLVIIKGSIPEDVDDVVIGVATLTLGFILDGVYAEYKFAKNGAKVINKVDDSLDIWKLKPTARGVEIEKRLAKTDYDDWYHIGAENNGYNELIDFQKGNNLVSLKTANTGGNSWGNDIMKHIVDLDKRRGTVDGNPANMILDLRVQPGGYSDAKHLIEYGTENNVLVKIKEF